MTSKKDQNADLDKAKEFAVELMNNLGFEYSDITTEVLKQEGEEENDEWMIKVEITGDNLANLIGRFGKTMYAFQHILNMSFNAERGEDRIKIIVDINSYREKREKELRSYADRALVEVKETNLPMALPPMKPAERRIIHLALKEEQGIITTSEGDEPNRYVIVKPA